MDVIRWFEGREKNCKLRFFQFDIVNFYPSITKDLLDRALNFLSRYIEISESDRDVIYAARKTLLYNRDITWEKKNGTWDVTMGSWDGAEVCEAVGLYLLHRLQTRGLPIGLYMDDGIGLSRLTSRRNEQIKKKIVRIFKEEAMVNNTHWNITYWRTSNLIHLS